VKEGNKLGISVGWKNGDWRGDPLGTKLGISDGLLVGEWVGK